MGVASTPGAAGTPANPARGNCPGLLETFGRRGFHTVLADPPWQFQNKTGKVAPEHKCLTRYGTMPLDEIAALAVAQLVTEPAHLYLWVPNALLPDGLRVVVGEPATILAP